MIKLKLTYEKSLAYLKNLLSNKERHALEKNIMKDTFEADAFDGLNTLTSEEFENDIKNIQKKISKRSTKNTKIIRVRNYSIAASILLFIGLGSITYLLNNTDKKLLEPTDVVTSPKTIENNFEKLEFDESKITDIDTLKDTANEIVVSVEEDIEEYLEINYQKSVPKEKIKLEKSLLEKLDVTKSSLKNKTDTKKTRIHSYKDRIEISDAITTVTIDSIVDKFNMDRALNQQTTDLLISETTKIIKGKVLDSDGQPLPGTNVAIEGKNKGTTTDFDGNFSIEAAENSTLVFDYIGFEQAIHAVNDSMSIVMQTNEASLDEVVIVGYGTQKKSNIVGSITSVKKSNLNINITDSSKNIESTLAGRVSGITISNSNALIKSKQEFKIWIIDNINTSLFKKNKKYTIKTTFNIDTTGQISNIKVFRYKKRIIKGEIKSLLSKSPLWIPATKDGKNIIEKIELTFDILIEQN